MKTPLDTEPHLWTFTTETAKRWPRLKRLLFILKAIASLAIRYGKCCGLPAARWFTRQGM
jgi:hypothetical protein